MSMKYSCFLPSGFLLDFVGFDNPVDAHNRMTEIAKAADESGFESVYLPDQLTPAFPIQAPIFETWTTVAALARDTERIRVGPMVSGNGYRNPALVAKMASTVDVLSNGRLAFGIGAGWFESDFTRFGYPFGDVPERLRKLGEAVQIIKGLWTEEEFTFEGKYYQVKGAINQPKGVQNPIPMLIAGTGEKVTLKLVAKYGDGCNINESPEGLAHKYSVLKNHCEDVGRDYGEILRTGSSLCVITDTDEEAEYLIPPWVPEIYPGEFAKYLLIGTIDTIRERIATYEAAGVQELAITFGQAVEDPDILRRFAAEFINP
jgi:F420-dependent oxidoreductase-like protein